MVGKDAIDHISLLVVNSSEDLGAQLTRKEAIELTNDLLGAEDGNEKAFLHRVDAGMPAALVAVVDASGMSHQQEDVGHRAGNGQIDDHFAVIWQIGTGVRVGHNAP